MGKRPRGRHQRDRGMQAPREEEGEGTKGPRHAGRREDGALASIAQVVQVAPSGAGGLVQVIVYQWVAGVAPMVQPCTIGGWMHHGGSDEGEGTEGPRHAGRREEGRAQGGGPRHERGQVVGEHAVPPQSGVARGSVQREEHRRSFGLCQVTLPNLRDWPVLSLAGGRATVGGEWLRRWTILGCGGTPVAAGVGVSIVIPDRLRGRVCRPLEPTCGRAWRAPCGR
jgi:hypothetical protein